MHNLQSKILVTMSVIYLSQFSKFWVCLPYSPFPPSHKYFTVWKSQYINNSLMNRYSMSNSFLMSKSVLNIYLFSAESGQASYRKVPCFTKTVLEWYKHVSQIHNFLCPFDDKSRATVQVITFTVFISLFTVIHNSLFFFVQLYFCLRVTDWVRSDWVPM